MPSNADKIWVSSHVVPAHLAQSHYSDIKCPLTRSEAKAGWGSVVSAHPSHGPTRARLRLTVPPYNGEGESPR